MQIKNITIGEYITLEDSTEYDIFVNTLNPKNLFCGRKANYKALTFDEVQVTRSILNNPNFQDIKDLFCMLYDIRGSYKQSADNEFLGQRVFDLFAAKKYLDDFIVSLGDREAKMLSGTPDVKAEMVNASKRLAPYNHLLTKLRLSKEHSCGDPDVIGRWKYSKVFNILVAEKVQADVMKDYNEIK